MQTVIGRLTKDARISSTKNGRNVVNFTVAQNDPFKPKGATEAKEVTTYFECAYWIGTGIAPYLQKGMLVEVVGRIGVNAWQNREGNLTANPSLQVQFLKLHGKIKTGSAAEFVSGLMAPNAEDDLPF